MSDQEIVKRKRGRPPKVKQPTQNDNVIPSALPFRTQGLRAYPKSAQLRDNKQSK